MLNSRRDKVSSPLVGVIIKTYCIINRIKSRQLKTNKMKTTNKRLVALYFTPLVLQVNIKYIVLCTLYFLFNTHYSFAQNLGVNATGATPNASSIIDLNTGNTFTSPNGKGLLPPNVALTSITDAVTITAPATSLLVYNSATAGTGTVAVVPGYYYWDGAKWVRLQTTASTSQDWSLLGNAGTTAGTNFIGTTDAQDVVVKTNGVENMRITTIGQLRNTIPTNIIGTDGQGENTNSIVWGINTFGYAMGIYNKSAIPGSNGLAIKTYTNSANNTILDLSTGTDNVVGTTVMSVKSNGNVGIGTTTPATKLSIVATATNTGFQLQDGSEGAGKLLISDATGKASWASSTGTTTVINSNAGNGISVGLAFSYTGSNATIITAGYYIITTRLLLDKSPAGCGAYIAFNIGTSPITPTGLVIPVQDVHMGASVGPFDICYTSVIAYLNVGTYYQWIRSDGACATNVLRTTLGENSFSLALLK